VGPGSFGEPSATITGRARAIDVTPEDKRRGAD
jgi:hypothetical protein